MHQDIRNKIILPFSYSLILGVLLVLVPVFSLAQQQKAQGSIQGMVVDSAAHMALEYSLITLLQAADSTLVRFVRAGKDGRFRLNDLEDGNYLLTISYPNYTGFTERIQLSPPAIHNDLKKVNLLRLPKLLQEVTIIGRNALRIKGDTIEYNPEGYTIRPDSKVEDLLRQLPGIQVNKDGQIVAQGQLVRQVLLDGEEFFGDDPTLITRNIRGDMVSKVQLYDKKSAQTAFTGVDDGKRSKTINIELKEDKKNGYFGKLQGGLGSRDFYEGQAMFNKFTKSNKAAAFGTAGNTGTLGLNNQDNNRYAAPNAMGDAYNSNGMFSLDQLEEARFSGRGIPQAYSGGAHFDSNWKDKTRYININYKAGDLEIKNDNTEEAVQTLPGNIINTRALLQSSDRTFRQTLNAKLVANIDQKSSLTFYLQGNTKHTRNRSDFQSVSTGDSGNLLNRSNRDIMTAGDEQALRLNVLWNKKLQKSGRTISLELDQQSGWMARERSLSSRIVYFAGRNPGDSVELVDQLKHDQNNSVNFNANLVYTEPLSKNMLLAANYRLNINTANSSQLSYNSAADGRFTRLDSTFSNIFKLGQYTNLLGLSLTHHLPKSLLNIGMAIATVDFRQDDRFRGQLYKRHFNNYNPRADWTYRKSNSQSFNISYQGFNIQPLIGQVQPLRSNIDPLNVTIGNPDLEPAFKHNLNTSFAAYNMMSGRMLKASLSTSSIVNDITNTISTDASGASVFRYVNLKNHLPRTFNASLFYGAQFKKTGLSLGASLNYNNQVSYNYVNEQTNKSNAQVISLYLNTAKFTPNRYSFSLEAGPSYTVSTLSQQAGLSNKALGANATANGSVFLPGKIELVTDLNYSYYPSTALFRQSLSRMIWNASINRKLLKKEVLMISIRMNDILNENVGFSRWTAQNIINQNYYTTIRRYLMLSVTWDFNRM